MCPLHAAALGAQGEGGWLCEQFPSEVDVISWCKQMLDMGRPGLLSFHPVTSLLPFSWLFNPPLPRD